MSDTTKTQNLPFATDEECEQLRQRLVRAGKIVPTRRVVATGTVSIAAPHVESEPRTRSRRRNIADIPEEGTYKVRRIRNDEEYEKRKGNYLIMLQSILKSRIELGLEFGGQDDEGEETDGQA